MTNQKIVFVLKNIQLDIQHLYVPKKVNGSEMFLMEDNFESSWSKEDENLD